jgi:hypothetical protein
MRHRREFTVDKEFDEIVVGALFVTDDGLYLKAERGAVLLRTGIQPELVEAVVVRGRDAFVTDGAVEWRRAEIVERFEGIEAGGLYMLDRHAGWWLAVRASAAYKSLVMVNVDTGKLASPGDAVQKSASWSLWLSDKRLYSPV